MDSHIRSIKVWWEMGYGSGLAREVENLVWCEALSGPGDSMLGGRRLGLVQGILETSPGHSVKSGNTWFQCVSHLLHSRARQCPHNFAFVTLELLKVSEETETKKNKKKVLVCVSAMEIPRFHHLLQSLYTSHPLVSVCGCWIPAEFTGWCWSRSCRFRKHKLPDRNMKTPATTEAFLERFKPHRGGHWRRITKWVQWMSSGWS